MEENKSLAKMYVVKAVYFFTAAFASVISIIATKNYDLTMLGIWLYFTPIAIENYMKNVYNKPTVILRRIGYILPSVFILINVLIFILCSNIPAYKFIISTKGYIGATILVTVPLVLISILDIFLYGFNKEEIKVAEYTKERLKEYREQSKKLILKQEEELKKEERRFKVERSKKKG